MRYAVRTLSKSRAFAAAAMVTLALAIGASTAIFSAIDNVLLDPFPYSLGLSRIIAKQLWGVSPYDPVTLAALPALLLFVALLACWVPARRAAGVDPLVALRHE